jgi:hypothetical protein
MRLPALALVVLAALLSACSGDTPDERLPAPTVVRRDALIIRSLDIDAQLAAKTYQVGAALPSPDGPYDIALYDFGGVPGLGGAPGQGGNVVMSGRSVAHEGCVGAEAPCNGVFVRLRFIKPGDGIELLWRGEAYRYQAVAVCGVPVAQFVDSVYRRTAGEQLTLLSDVRDSQSGSSIVIVIVARPAPVTAAEDCPVGTLPLLAH